MLHLRRDNVAEFILHVAHLRQQRVADLNRAIPFVYIFVYILVVIQILC